MKKKHILMIVLVILVCVCLAIYGLLGYGRSGGKVWFEAVILEINGNTVKAAVISSGNTPFSPNLPDEITFTANSTDLENVKVGDAIEGEWQYGTAVGKNVRVFWFTKEQ